MSVTFTALGTTAVVATTDPEAEGEAVAAVADELAAVDLACSRFREDSELSTVVRHAGRPVPVSPLFVDALAAALAAAQATDGLVDPTVARTLRLSGYDSTYRVVAARDGDAFRARFEPVPGWQTIELDRAASTVRVPAGVEIDLGATAKAFAADRCATRVAAAFGCGVLVGLGGDIAVAGTSPANGWPVGIADDHRAGDVQQVIAIRHGGVATSSTTVRRWRSGARILNHLIDPRTARTVESCWRTVSVYANTCFDANTASTAAIILGVEAVAWLEARGACARLVAVDDAVATTAGWPAEDRVAA